MLNSEIAARLRRWAQDPFEFLKEAVYTRDQVDEEGPIKIAPAKLGYIYTLVRLWEHEDIIVIHKSRRMWCSWLFISLYLWDILFHNERDIFFVSDVFKKSDSLVERAKFIFDHIPTDLWPLDLRPRMNRIEGEFSSLDPKHNSHIYAIAQGKDQLRQETGSGLLFDEFGFWPLAKETYTAARPIIQGGGRLTIISTSPEIISSEPSFFQQLVEDTIE